MTHGLLFHVGHERNGEQLKEGRVFWAHNAKVQSIMVEKAWQQEKVAGWSQCMCTQKAERKKEAYA